MKKEEIMQERLKTLELQMANFMGRVIIIEQEEAKNEQLEAESKNKRI